MLSFSKVVHSPRLHKVHRKNWITLPFCLLPEFCVCLKKYSSVENGNLGMLQEFAASNKRICIIRDDKQLQILTQLFRPDKGCWETVFNISFKEEQVPILINFIKYFCLGKMEEIKKSCSKRKKKMGQYNTQAAL